MADTDSHVQQEDLTYNARSNSDVSNNAISNYFGNNSFSGSDMVAIMHITGIDGVRGTYTLGSLQTLSYSTSMQRMPVRSIGNVNAKDYVMGQRTIAGSLVFAVFDKHFAYEAMKAIKGISEEDYHFLADELPPFDITITFANEYGKIAKLAIYGVRLVNEGQVMSINDIYTENTYQYVATDIDYLSDQTTNTSGRIYEPLKPNPNSVSEPVEIEDIIVDETDEEEEDIAKYQIVYVKTKDAYVRDGQQMPGKIELDLYKRVEYGNIIVKGTNNTFEKGYELTTGVQFPIIDETIPEGEYDAKYFSGKSFSKNTQFVINNKKTVNPTPSTPVIVLEEKAADGTFTIGIQAVDAYTKGIQYTTNRDNESSWTIIDPPAPYSVIKGLQEHMTYYFRAYNDSEVSFPVSCYTDARKEHLFSDFKTYIDANKSYLMAEWPYFETMWNHIYAAWVLEPTGSVCVALEKCKPNLDLSSKESLNAYNRLCEIATKYEKDQIEYVSQKTEIKAPKIVKLGQRVIEFEKNVSTLEITCTSNGFKTIAQLLTFQVVNNKYQYVVNSKYQGMHKIVAKDSKGNHSPALVMYLPEKTFAEQLIQEEFLKTLATEKELNETKKTLDTTLSIPSLKDREIILKELNQNEKNSNKNIPCPKVKNITESEVEIYCSIPSVYIKTCYLCVCPSDNLGATSIKQRTLINKNEFTYMLYPSKNALINEKRYSLWIENEDNAIVSETTSFSFDQELKAIQSKKNEELIAKAKAKYKSSYLKNLTDAYEEVKDLTAFYIYENVMLDVINDMTLTSEKRSSYIYEAASAYYSQSRKQFPSDIVFSPRLGTTTGNFSNSTLTHLIIEIPAERELISYTFEIKDNKITHVAFDNFSDYAFFRFANNDLSDITSIVFFDFKNKTILGNSHGEKVVW